MPAKRDVVNCLQIAGASPYHSKEIVMKMTQNTRCLTAMLALSAVLYRIVFRANQQAGD
jgi:hypothetical protein